MEHKRAERRALAVGLGVNAFMVAAGLVVFFMTGLRAMFLDMAYTAISAFSGLVGIVLSTHTVRITDRYPNGRFALEPIYAIAKAVFALTLMAVTLLGSARVAWNYLRTGAGTPVTFGPVVVYEVVMVATCAALWLYYRRVNAAIGGTSTMLVAEEKGTLIDGAISGGIGVAAVALLFLPAGSPLDFLHYTGDFVITLLIVAAVAKEPVGVLREAYVELVGGVHEDEGTNDFVHHAALEHLPAGTGLDRVLVFKTGMNYTVDVYLAAAGGTIDVDDLVASKRALEARLVERLRLVDVDFVFD